MSKRKWGTFWAASPSEVRWNKKLSFGERVLYAELLSLMNTTGYCYMSNETLGERLGAKKKTVQGWIRNLIKEGFISSKMEKVGNSFRLQRRIRVIEITDSIIPETQEEVKKGGNLNGHIRDTGGYLNDPGGSLELPLIKDKKKSIKKDNNKLLSLGVSRGESLSDSYIDLLTDKKINNTISFRYKPNTPLSKTLQKAINSVKEIKSGRFRRREFNDSVIDSYNFKRIKGLDDDSLRKVLKVAFSRFKQMKEDPNIWPENKESIRWVSISDFFYNPITKKSWFMKCLSSKPEATKDSLKRNQLSSIEKRWAENYPSFKNKIMNLFPGQTEGKSEQWWFEYKITANNLLKWWEENWKGDLKEMNRGCADKLSTTTLFAETVYEFLEEVYPLAWQNFLPTRGDRWNKFKAWIKDGWKINIAPTKRQFEEFRKSKADAKDSVFQKRVEAEMQKIKINYADQCIDVPPDELEKMAVIAVQKDIAYEKEERLEKARQRKKEEEESEEE